MNLIKNNLNELRSDNNDEHDNGLNEKNNEIMILEYNYNELKVKQDTIKNQIG